MEINVEKTKMVRISSQASLIQIIREQNQQDNVKYFRYFTSMVGKDVICSCEIKARLPWQKAACD
jgi:hypothetical protein